MGIRPPGIAESWDTCNVWSKAQILAFAMLRDYEEQEEKIEFQKLLATCLGVKTRL